MPEDVLFTARNCFNLWRTPLDNSDILMFQRLHNDIVNIDREMVLQEYYCCVCFEVRFICVLFIVFNSLIAVCLVRSLMNSSVFDLGRVMSRKECLVTVCVCPAMTQNARISLTLFVSLTSARLAVLFCWRIHKSTQTRVSCFLREIIRKLKMKTGTLSLTLVKIGLQSLMISRSLWDVPLSNILRTLNIFLSGLIKVIGLSNLLWKVVQQPGKRFCGATQVTQSGVILALVCVVSVICVFSSSRSFSKAVASTMVTSITCVSFLSKKKTLLFKLLLLIQTISKWVLILMWQDTFSKN